MATQKTHFVPNPLLEEELKRSTLLVDDMVEAANDIKAHIEENAPVDSGEFRDSFVVEGGVDEDGAHAVVYSTDWKAYFIEFGTAEHPFSAPIRRGVEAAGYQAKGE